MLSAANASFIEQHTFAELLERQYKRRIIQLSANDYHTIFVHVPEQSDGINKYWDEREYEYHKIRREDYEKSRELMAVYGEYDYQDETGVERIEAMLHAYEFLASCYLKMSSDDFKNADWQEVKDVINACEYRTHNSIAPESRNLYELFFYGQSKKLTKTERDAVDMYRLWKNWHTKPWEINGGIIYPEDIQAVLRIEEIQVEAERREREKEEARQRMKKMAKGR